MSETVKRYNMDVGKFGNVNAYESEHGRWVKRDDYARLEQECERLRAALEKAALAMWNSEANMDNEAAEAEVVLAEAALSDKP